MFRGAKPREPLPPADEDEDEDRRTKPASRAARDDEDEEEDGPRKPAAKRRRDDEDEEDDRPRKSGGRRSRADDDDDDDDRPARKEKKKGGAGKVLLILGVIGLFLCGGCGALGYWVYVKINEGVDAARGAMTDFNARIASEQERQKQLASGRETHRESKKETPTTSKVDTSKLPDKRPMYAAEQQLADQMHDNPTRTMKLYGPQPLQLTGKVVRVNVRTDGQVEEIIFEPQVEDLRTHQKKPYPINCRLTTPVPKSQAAVGNMVTVRGDITGASKTSTTLNNCVLVGPGSP